MQRKSQKILEKPKIMLKADLIIKYKNQKKALQQAKKFNKLARWADCELNIVFIKS